MSIFGHENNRNDGGRPESTLETDVSKEQEGKGWNWVKY